jgi:hypothetical protein
MLAVLLPGGREGGREEYLGLQRDGTGAPENRAPETV